MRPFDHPCPDAPMRRRITSSSVRARVARRVGAVVAPRCGARSVDGRGLPGRHRRGGNGRRDNGRRDDDGRRNDLRRPRRSSTSCRSRRSSRPSRTTTSPSTAATSSSRIRRRSVRTTKSSMPPRKPSTAAAERTVPSPPLHSTTPSPSTHARRHPHDLPRLRRPHRLGYGLELLGRHDRSRPVPPRVGRSAGHRIHTTRTQRHLRDLGDAWPRTLLPGTCNVTTEDPGVDALMRSGFGDEEYGIRAIITPDHEWYSSQQYGGVAYLRSFSRSSDLPAWVFSSNLGTGNPKSVAEAVSHEVGHTLGLQHDGHEDGSSSSSYYSGHGNWAPIMGVGYYREVTQWSDGSYPGATNTEDDLAIIDEFIDRLPTATGGAELPASAASTTTHILGESGATQTHSLTVTQGPVSIALDKLDANGNLLAALTVRGPAGQFVGSAAPVHPASWSLTVDLPATATPGTYTVEVRSMGWAGSGSSDPGFDAYGSIGGYCTVSVQMPTRTATTTPPPPPSDGSTTPPQSAATALDVHRPDRSPRAGRRAIRVTGFDPSTHSGCSTLAAHGRRSTAGSAPARTCSWISDRTCRKHGGGDQRGRSRPHRHRLAEHHSVHGTRRLRAHVVDQLHPWAQHRQLDHRADDCERRDLRLRLDGHPRRDRRDRLARRRGLTHPGPGGFRSGGRHSHRARDPAATPAPERRPRSTSAATCRGPTSAPSHSA